MFKLRISGAISISLAVLAMACKYTAKTSEEKMLKDNFYGNPNESGIWQQSEAFKARASMKDKELVITFDDGPRGFTNDILDFLKEENIKASFFVIGNTLIDEKGLANGTYINHKACS